MKNKDEIINKAFDLVKKAIDNGTTKYKIAQDTGISEKTIGNYANEKTKPTYPNALVLIQYFKEETVPAQEINEESKYAILIDHLLSQIEKLEIENRNIVVEKETLIKRVGYYEGLLEQNGIDYSRKVG